MIVRLVPKRDPNVVIDRLWLVFFGEAEGNPWWSRFLPPGYRHVTACAWFDEQQRWVYFNPTRRGTVILLYREDEFGGRMQQLIDTSSCCLRVRSTLTRSSTPFGWWCTGAIKALVGSKSWAITPYQLSRALLRAGAEKVDLLNSHSSTADCFSRALPLGHHPSDLLREGAEVIELAVAMPVMPGIDRSIHGEPVQT